jgi:hypothetical protein
VIADTLTREADIRKQAESDAWASAREGRDQVALGVEGRQALLSRLRGVLVNERINETMPVATAFDQYLREQLSMPGTAYDISGIDNLRRDIRNYAGQAAPGSPEQRIMTLVRKEYENALDDLASGIPEMARLRQAVAASRTYRELTNNTITSRSGRTSMGRVSGILQDLDLGRITPEEAAKRVLSGNVRQFLDEAESTLGPEIRDTFREVLKAQALRETLGRKMVSGRLASEGGYSGLAQQVENLVRRSDAEDLFDASELADLRAFAYELRNFQGPRATSNPSGTAGFMRDIMSQGTRRIPYAGEMLKQFDEYRLRQEVLGEGPGSGPVPDFIRHLSRVLGVAEDVLPPVGRMGTAVGALEEES